MKRKIIFAIATSFFAVITVFNLTVLNENGFRNVSLDAISSLAQAEPSEGTDDYAAERKYVTGSGYVDCQKSNGQPGKRAVSYWGYDCLGKGNVACTVSITFSYTSGCI